MFAYLIRQIMIEILHRARRQIENEGGWYASNPDNWPQSLKDLIEAYWDVKIFEKYGLLKTPDPEGPIEGLSPLSLQPQPEPSPMSGSLFRDSLLLDVLDLAMGDPNPQPDSWIQVLGNKQIRINSAKKLRDHFKKAIPQLEAEAKRLEKLQ